MHMGMLAKRGSIVLSTYNLTLTSFWNGGLLRDYVQKMAASQAVFIIFVLLILLNKEMISKNVLMKSQLVYSR